MQFIVCIMYIECNQHKMRRLFLYLPFVYDHDASFVKQRRTEFWEMLNFFDVQQLSTLNVLLCVLRKVVRNRVLVWG